MALKIARYIYIEREPQRERTTGERTAAVATMIGIVREGEGEGEREREREIEGEREPQVKEPQQQQQPLNESSEQQQLEQQ